MKKLVFAMLFVFFCTSLSFAQTAKMQLMQNFELAATITSDQDILGTFSIDPYEDSRILSKKPSSPSLYDELTPEDRERLKLLQEAYDKNNPGRRKYILPYSIDKGNARIYAIGAVLNIGDCNHDTVTKFYTAPVTVAEGETREIFYAVTSSMAPESILEPEYSEKFICNYKIVSYASAKADLDSNLNLTSHVVLNINAFSSKRTKAEETLLCEFTFVSQNDEPFSTTIDYNCKGSGNISLSQFRIE